MVAVSWCRVEDDCDMTLWWIFIVTYVVFLLLSLVLWCGRYIMESSESTVAKYRPKIGLVGVVNGVMR